MNVIVKLTLKQTLQLKDYCIYAIENKRRFPKEVGEEIIELNLFTERN